MIRYKDDNSQKSTDLNSILRSFFYENSNENDHKLRFLISNTRFHIAFPKHDLNFPPVSLRNTRFHNIFPKHNLKFSLVSLRNTQFHVISMGKHKHKMVQWVWNGLKQIKEEKNDIFWYFLKIALMVFCISKYCIVYFWYVSFILAQPVLAIKFRYDNYR